MKTPLATVVAAIAWSGTPPHKGSSVEPIRATVDNFARAEPHSYFARFARDGGFGKLQHERTLADIDRQSVIRLNRDALYSFGVFDLDASDRPRQELLDGQ